MKVKRKLSEKKNEKQFIAMAESYIVLMLFLSFFVFTFIGAGNFVIVSMTGLLLCFTGLMQGTVKVDLWILVPLIAYNAISLISGFRTYGNTVDGFASTQSVFPVIYLLTAYLDKNDRSWLKMFCCMWVGVMAVIGILQFTLASFHGGMGRLSGFMGNPNAMGAMLALGWFATESLLNDSVVQDKRPRKLMHAAEFMILTAMALTLSVGALGAFSVGFIVMCIYGRSGYADIISGLSNVIFAFGCGVLLYASANHTYWPWLSVLICLYIFTASIYRRQFEMFTKEHKVWAKAICAAGILGTLTLIYLRPNAAATFSERLEMIRNGLGYISAQPVLGIGPYQWRRLNLYDGDTYFNTWHIHNIFIHVGVELGLIAMAMLLVTPIRHITKKEDSAGRGGFTAAVVHNLMDTSFFYMATVPFLMMTAGRDEEKEHRLGTAAVKCIFGAFSVLFLWNFIQCVTA